MNLVKNIDIMQDFQYAINIAYDIYSDDKIKNYIPTPSAIELIEDIMLSTSPTSNDRAKILVGAPGPGPPPPAPPPACRCPAAYRH